MSMRFIDHVKEFRRLRAEFWNTPGVHEELRAYEARDNDYEYKILKGLIPKPLVGRTTNDIGPAWQKSDTFFTDFHTHYDPRRVLSSTEDSYIICNVACHDTRLYSSDIDPSSSDKTAAAGMSYMHLLVIPSEKVYNAVSHLDRSLITEMKTHFWEFWFSDGSINKIIHAVHDAMERRYTVVAEAYQRNDAATAPQRLAHLDAVMEECRISAADFAKKLRAGRNRVDIVYGFHAHPHHSVGHMHMHVLLADPRFRTQSTLAHDWKTLPFEAVEYVFHREEIERNRMY
ncbi:HIT domain-containing protein [Pleurotus pulmonarius]